jgi:hypothetical protein
LACGDEIVRVATKSKVGLLRRNDGERGGSGQSVKGGREKSCFGI